MALAARIAHLFTTLSCSFALALPADAQARQAAGTYQNPVLFADYSDPDVIRDGRDFYLVSSSFTYAPGLPILQSRDLVHWRIVAHALPRLGFAPRFDLSPSAKTDPRTGAPATYGRGVWAPAVRFHKGRFYLYFPTPDEGIFLTTAPHMTGPWSAPVAVLSGPGYEDPCPFWDEDGQAYLLHSRTGAGPLILHRMSPDGTRVLDEGKLIVQDRAELPTLEGPKLYKHDGWYTIFAPFGGVGQGSQTVLRSRNLYGPYEHRTVLTQGPTAVNGPHQGAWVTSTDGRDWFVHFQERGSHGRIVWLEPMRWLPDGWPLMGTAAEQPDASSSQSAKAEAEPVTASPAVGYPMLTGPLPALFHGPAARWHPQTSDEFASRTLGLQWQWNHNPEDAHWSLAARPGWLRLSPSQAPSLAFAPNTLTESMQDDALEFTTRLESSHLAEGTHAGLTVLDRSFSSIAVVQQASSRQLVMTVKGAETPGPTLTAATLQLRATVNGDTCQYSYSLDEGKSFQPLGSPVTLAFSTWTGARPGLFAYTTGEATGSAGFADFDWAHYVPLPDAAPGVVK